MQYSKRTATTAVGGCGELAPVPAAPACSAAGLGLRYLPFEPALGLAEPVAGAVGFDDVDTMGETI
jgi:hypothetical protein